MMSPRLIILSLFLTISILAGCSSSSVGANTMVVSAEIDEFQIPPDTAKEKYLLYVKPVEVPRREAPYMSTGKPVGGANCVQYAGNQTILTYSLMSALGQVGNFSVIDAEEGRSKVTPKKGERGPFEVRATLTEFNTLAEYKETGPGLTKRWGRDDSEAEIIGKAIIRSPLTMITMLTGIPTEWANLEVVGVVGFDVSITDPKTRKILASFPVHGRFTTRELEIGSTVFGYHSKQSAGSVSEGAIRAASHDAATKIYEKLAILEP